MIGGYAATTSGIIVYQSLYGSGEKTLGIANIAFFTAWTILVEVIYQIWLQT